MVGNLNVRRPCIGPNEADPELIVDADAVLSRSITYQQHERAVMTPAPLSCTVLSKMASAKVGGIRQRGEGSALLRTILDYLDPV